MTDILGQDIMYAPGVGPKRKEMLKKELGIETFGQLLEHYPYKYIDRRHVYRISELMESMSFVPVSRPLTPDGATNASWRISAMGTG